MRLLCLFLIATGCGGSASDDKEAPADTGSPTDTDPVVTDTDTDTDTVITDTDTATTGSPTADTAEPIPAPELTELSAELHPTFESLVVVSWSQDVAADVFVEYSFDAGEWHLSPVRSLEAGPHEQVLAGIPYGLDVTWRVVVTTPTDTVTSADEVITTGPVPPFVPVTTVNTLDVAGVDAAADYVLLSVPALDGGFGGAWHVMIVDRVGRPVWVRRSDVSRMSMHPRLSWDGTAILHDQNQFWVDFGLGDEGTVQKLRLDGTLVHEWPTPGLHHPYQELPDGSLAYGAFTYFYDESLVVTHPDDSQTYLWSCDTWAASIGASTACASNTLNYDEATDTFLFSFWTLETVVQIDSTGQALRWFGHAPGSYAFAPEESTFWFQHGAHLTDDGTLLVSTHQDEFDYQLVAREYTIDEGTETLTEIWSAGVDAGVEGRQMGDAYRTPSGHTLQSYGTQARVREYAPDGTVVWDLAWPQVSHVGRVTALPDIYALLPEQP